MQGAAVSDNRSKDQNSNQERDENKADQYEISMQ